MRIRCGASSWFDLASAAAAGSQPAERPTVYLIDCPTGGYWFGPFLTYRKIKDLACLDKLGCRYLSRVQRLRFYLDYIGHARLSADDKQRIRKIVKFFEGRE